MGKAMHSGMPFSISVEPTTTCNLRCPECPTGLQQITRPQGQIKVEMFRDILDQLTSHLAFLNLYFQGEPFLHPEYFELIRLCEENNIYTASSTNAHFLRGDTARKIVESRLDRLIVSIDGADQGVYEKYRRGGDWETVKKAVLEIMDWKKKLKSRTPFLILQFLVFKHNEHQVPEMKLLAKELGVDKLEFKSAQVHNFEEDTKYIPDSRRYARYVRGADDKWKLKKPIRNRCFRMWSGAVITWDGVLLPCCFDKDADHPIGIMTEQSFRTIWKGTAYNRFRNQILNNRRGMDICKNCTE